MPAVNFPDGRRWNYCDACGNPIPVYQNGSVPEGYVSPEIWRLEEESVEGVNGIRPVSRTVCCQCYIDAFGRQYPGAECELKYEEGNLPEWVSPSLQTTPIQTATESAGPVPSFETDSMSLTPPDASTAQPTSSFSGDSASTGAQDAQDTSAETPSA